MGRFRRDLDSAFVEALNAEREKGGWWSEVVEDRDLIVALRGDYLNVYHHGQSIFRVTHARGEIAATTHPKYLLDPKLSKPVPFNGTDFSLGTLTEEAFLSHWDSAALGRLKQAAKVYSGTEKEGCHRAVVRNPRLVDVEVAFSRDRDSEPEQLREEERIIPRIDLLLLERSGDGYELQFWEAKAFGNPELGSMVRATGRSGDPIQRAVVGQIENYRRVLADTADELRQSYAAVCANLVALYEGTDRYPEGCPVAEVAADPERLRDKVPSINLLLFGFDGAQKKIGKEAFDHLKEEVERLGGTLRHIGDPKGAFGA